ncbi:hypothetical protein UT300018_22870 [Clostridium faecium]
MDNDTLRSLRPEIREKVMREELGEEKCRILDKYDLHPNERLYWERIQEKYPVQSILVINLLKKHQLWA